MKDTTKKKIPEEFKRMHAAVEKAAKVLVRMDPQAGEFSKDLFDRIMFITISASLAASVDPGRVLQGLCYLFHALDIAGDREVAKKDKIHLN